MFDELATAFHKHKLSGDKAEFLQLFFNEFMSLFPEEATFNLSLSILLDFLMTKSDKFRCAALEVIGTMLQYVS